MSFKMQKSVTPILSSITGIYHISIDKMSIDIPPNQTLYVNNLNEKVKKEG